MRGQFKTIHTWHFHVQQHDIRNVEDLLRALPAEQFESFTLMTESGSRHLASPEFPRIITYGPDPRFMLAASGNPDDPHYYGRRIFSRSVLPRT